MGTEEIAANSFPSLSQAQPKLVGCFIARCLAGGYCDKEEQKWDALLTRLVDFAVAEYEYARERWLQELNVREMSQEEIFDQGGQVLHQLYMINHFESCMNAVSRVIRFMNIKGLSHKNVVKNMRDSIEHMDERIQKDPNAMPVAIAFNEEEYSVVISARDPDKKSYKLKVSDLGNVLTELHTNLLAKFT